MDIHPKDHWSTILLLLLLLAVIVKILIPTMTPARGEQFTFQGQPLTRVQR